MILVILFEGQYIRFYQFSDNPHDLELKKSSVIDLNEKEIYNDDVYDLTKLEAIVRDEVKKQKYPRKNVKILLNNRQLILRELSVPMGNEDETQTMVANEMIMSLNLSNDYVVTYTKLLILSWAIRMKMALKNSGCLLRRFRRRRWQAINK